MADSTNPVINQDGTASVSPGSHATWETANGSNSTLNITNASGANTMTLAISGAPGSGLIVTLNGESQSSLDNIFTLPPNSPAYALVAFGNFNGSTVTINNITNAGKPADATVTAQTTES
jgi:hypothetical protein